MIELLITATIIYTMNVNKPCDYTPQSVIEGCYDHKIDTIYVKSKNITRPQDFILFHEIGHSLFDNNFPNTFINREEMADQFALWIYENKYPNHFIKANETSKKYFSKNCNEKCIDEIINIKPPNMVYPIENFFLSSGY